LTVLVDDGPTIMLNGSRAGDGEGRRVFAQGTTTNLEGRNRAGASETGW
jgi:hypothetical protein